MSRIADAYEEVARAAALLRTVKGSFWSFFESDAELREVTTQAIHAARASVERARALIEVEAIQDDRWDDTFEKLTRLPRVLIVQPLFGKVEIRGARSVESAGAASDVKALERVLQTIRELAEASADKALADELARIHDVTRSSDGTTAS